MRFLKALFILNILFLFSCYPSDEELRRQVNSRFEGEWIGTYDGDDKGELTYKVTNAGNLNGNLKSNPTDNSEEFSGYIQSDGQLTASTRSGHLFNGIANFDSFTGKWTKQNGNETLKGTFKVQKK